MAALPSCGAYVSFDKVVALVAVKYLHLHMREQDQLARGRILCGSSVKPAEHVCATDEKSGRTYTGAMMLQRVIQAPPRQTVLPDLIPLYPAKIGDKGSVVNPVAQAGEYLDCAHNFVLDAMCVHLMPYQITISMSLLIGPDWPSTKTVQSGPCAVPPLAWQ